MKNINLLLPVTFLLIFICFVTIYYSSLQEKFFRSKIYINKNEINVEIADTESKREIGLSNRDKMFENEGMIFIFDNYGYYDFWMKEMRFPLDVLWIKDDTVVEITENLFLDKSNPNKTYKPTTKINKVLELNAGYVKKNHIIVGDIVSNIMPD